MASPDCCDRGDRVPAGRVESTKVKYIIPRIPAISRDSQCIESEIRDIWPGARAGPGPGYFDSVASPEMARVVNDSSEGEPSV